MELLRVARFDLALDADVADIDVSDFGEMGMPLSCLQPPANRLQSPVMAARPPSEQHTVAFRHLINRG